MTHSFFVGRKSLKSSKFIITMLVIAISCYKLMYRLGSRANSSQALTDSCLACISNELRHLAQACSFIS